MHQNWATESQFFEIDHENHSFDSFLSFADWKHLQGKEKSLPLSIFTIWIFFFQEARKDIN